MAEPQLAAMARLPWNTLSQVGDQSIYVTEIVKQLRQHTPIIRDMLYSVRYVGWLAGCRVMLPSGVIRLT